MVQALRVAGYRSAPRMNPTLRAAFWMTGAIVSFTAMAVAGRAVAFELDTFETMMYRSLVGAVVVLVVASAAGTLNQVRLRRLDIHLVRNISHFTGQNLWFYAITVVPLAQVFALEFTLPIWVLLMSPLILNERLTRMRVLAAVLGFIGILIVTRPGTAPPSFGLVAAALAAIGFAGSAVCTRLLTRTETVTCILFWLVALQLVFGVVCAGIDGEIALPSAASVPWIVVIGLAGLLAHFCLTTALSLAPAAVVVPIDFARLPVIAVVGWALYNEPLEPAVILGAVLIFGGNYLNIWWETRAR